MEWIIGLVVIWFILKVMKGNSEEAIKRAISVAYNKRKDDPVCTKIPWSQAETFITKHGGEINYFDDGGVSSSLEMLIDKENVMIIFTRYRLDGTTCIDIGIDTNAIMNELLAECDDPLLNKMKAKYK